jgi:hypothetical protein
MMTEQVSEWNFSAGSDRSSNDILYTPENYMETNCAFAAFFNEASFPEIASIGSAKHFSGGCEPCSFFVKGRCSHGFTCQQCHMHHKPEGKKRNGARHRRSEFHEGEQQRMGPPVVALDPLALLTEPLKVPISEDVETPRKFNDVPSEASTPEKLLPDGTCLARALTSDVNFPIQMSTLPNSSHTHLLGPLRHGSTNHVEPPGLHKSSQVDSESSYISNSQVQRSQCAREVQERYIHELEAQNAFLRTCLMQCYHLASASI